MQNADSEWTHRCARRLEVTSPRCITRTLEVMTRRELHAASNENRIAVHVQVHDVPRRGAALHESQGFVRPSKKFPSVVNADEQPQIVKPALLAVRTLHRNDA